MIAPTSRFFRFHFANEKRFSHLFVHRRINLTPMSEELFKMQKGELSYVPMPFVFFNVGPEVGHLSMEYVFHPSEQIIEVGFWLQVEEL